MNFQTDNIEACPDFFKQSKCWQISYLWKTKDESVCLLLSGLTSGINWVTIGIGTSSSQSDNADGWFGEEGPMMTSRSWSWSSSWSVTLELLTLIGLPYHLHCPHPRIQNHQKHDDGDDYQRDLFRKLGDFQNRLLALRCFSWTPSMWCPWCP